MIRNLREVFSSEFDRFKASLPYKSLWDLVLTIAGKRAGGFLWLLVFVLALLPQSAPIERPEVWWWLAAYAAYAAILVLANLLSPHLYKSTRFKHVRIQARIILITVLIFISSGPQSYFWFFYSLPLFVTALHFRSLKTSLLVYTEIVIISAGILVLFGWPQPALYIPLFIANNAILLLVVLVLHYLFQTQTRLAREQAIEERHIDALYRTILGLGRSQEFTPLLQTIIQNAADLLNAPGGGIYLLTPERDRTKLSAVWGLPSRLVGNKLRLDEGLSGQVIRSERALVNNQYQQMKNKLSILDDYRIVSVVSAPIKANGEILGAIAVHNTAERSTFDDQAMELLSRFGDYAAIAIETARTRQSAASIFSLDLNELLQTIIDELRQLFKKDDLIPSILLLNKEIDPPMLMFSSATSFAHSIEVEAEKERAGIRLGEGLCGWVAKYKRSLLVPGVKKPIEPIKGIEEVPKYLPLNWSVQSELTVPIIYQDEVLGVVDLESTSQSAFDDNDRILLEDIAKRFAPWIYIAYSFSRLKQRARHLAAVQDILEPVLRQLDVTAGNQFDFHENQIPIIQSREVSDAIEYILREAVDNISIVEGEKAIFANFRAHDPANHCLVLTNIYPPNEAEVMKVNIGDKSPLTGDDIGVVGNAAKLRKPLLIPDVDDKERNYGYRPYHPKSHSELAVPVLYGDKLLGVLNLEHSQLGGLTKDDEIALVALARLIVIVVWNATQAEARSTDREILAMSLWGAELTHEVETGVGFIRVAVENARTLKAVLRSAPKLGSYLDKIDDHANRILIPPLPEHPPVPGQTPMPSEAAQVDAIVLKEIELQKIREAKVDFLDQTGCPGVLAAIHPNWLFRVIRHLLANAVRFMPEGMSNPQISVATSLVDGNCVQILIADNGAGVPPEVAPILFKKPVARDGHRGKGLILVRHIVSLHGGTINLVEKSPGNGATFSVKLPISQRMTNGGSTTNESPTNQ